MTIDVYGDIRASNGAESASSALDLFKLLDFLVFESGWIIAFFVQSFRDDDSLFGTNVDAQSTTFASFFINFYAAFQNDVLPLSLSGTGILPSMVTEFNGSEY